MNILEDKTKKNSRSLMHQPLAHQTEVRFGPAFFVSIPNHLNLIDLEGIGDLRGSKTLVTARTIGCNPPLTRIGYHNRSGKDPKERLEVDFETRRKKQQALMVQLVERKVRSRAKQLYETRGQEEGQALQDWFQAESEVLGNSILAPLYRRMRTNQDSAETQAPELASEESDVRETPA